MSRHDSKLSRASVWMTVIVLLPVLYLLSVPPLLLSTGHVDGELGFVYPRWAEVYGKPFEWIATNTPLRKPLSVYFAWLAKQRQQRI